MKKFILSSSPDSGGMVFLGGKDYHYLVRVRRLRPGSVFGAFLLDNTEIKLSVCSIDGGVLRARQSPECREPEPLPAWPPLYLFQALPKGNKMDLIVRQAAECGVFQIHPFESEYSQVKAGDFGAEKTRRWERIVREARQQSGSPVPTVVKNPCALEALLDYWEGLKSGGRRGVGILLHQDPLEQGALHDYLGDNPEFAVLAVGPEGGFSPGETGRFIATGFKPLRVGNAILRTETAALYGAAAIRIILLETASWAPKIR